MSATHSAEVVALCRAQLNAIVGGRLDPFGAAWDSDMSGDERQFWCRASGLGGYGWAYAGRAWSEIGATHQAMLKAGVRKIAGRAALLMNA